MVYFLTCDPAALTNFCPRFLYFSWLRLVFMSLKQIRKKARYLSQYIPFTINTVLWVLAVWLCYRILYSAPAEDPAADTDSFRALVVLMGKIAYWFVTALAGVSVISALLSWLHYLWLQKKKGPLLDLRFTTETKGSKSPRLYIDAQLQGTRRPLLGFVKGRLFYDDHQMTGKFPLLSNKRKENSLRRIAISGRSRLLLPDIREYQLQGGFIYFEDMLQLLSLPVRQPLNGQFYQPPTLTEAAEHEAFPKKTETTDVRIEQMRRVEGEYLNYKDFEAGDDVRRIVWKVYARNRELVVRIPEMFEPYASHLYFYASFEASVKKQWFGDGYFSEMLNYYKNRVWTVYDTLAKKEWEMRYIPDQRFSLPEDTDAAGRAARIISNSEWQQDTPVSSYFNARQGAVLCISSLVDPHELEAVLAQCDSSTVVYYIRLSGVFRHFVAWGWLKRLIFLPPEDRLSRLRSAWMFSPIRVQIRKREREIEQLLQRSHVITGTL